MNVLGKLKQYRNNNRLISLEKKGFISLSKSSVYCDGFRVEVRHPKTGHQYLQIGNPSNKTIKSIK